LTTGPRKAPRSTDLSIEVTVREANGAEAEAMRRRQLAALTRLLRVAVERRRAKDEDDQRGQYAL